MINEGIGNYLIHDGEVEETSDTKGFDEIKENPLYEVVTVKEGIPLFFEEHMDRLKATAHMLGIELSRSIEEIKNDFYKLINVNKIEKSFIKLLISENTYLVYEFWDQAPSKEDIKNGVDVAIFDYERDNPNAKIFYRNFKAEVSKFIISTGSFEALLRTKDGELLEGSRTNLYFTKGDKIITAPDDKVLKGITRTRIEKICENENIPIEKKIIKDIDLVDIDGAFITGTTAGIVPIRKIESIILNSQEEKVVKDIINGYLKLQKEYINERK